MRVRAWLERWGPFLLLCAVCLYYAGYVKDDSYIGYRYAANWARGLGPVFNPGERVEGFTSSLWVAFLAALHLLGVPLLLGAKLAGAAAALAGLCWTRRLAELAHPDRPEAASRAAWLYAASPTLGLWAASGMEPTISAAAAAGTALAVARAARLRSWPSASLAGLAIAACAMLRPEGHLLLALLLAAPRALPAALALLVPFHAARYLYFGDLLPNTFYIKAGGVALGDRLEYLGLFLLFYGHALLLGLALLGARGRDLLTKLLGALVGAFVAYLLYVGGDEMRWFRLFLPALPFAIALAAPRVPRLLVGGFVLFGLIAHGSAWPLRGYLEQDHRAYFPLADAIAARARPGDRALFQDCGATPYRALDVAFDDPLGLNDRRVTRLYREARWSPFRGAGPPALEAALRDELFRRDPRFIAFVAYIERRLQRDVRERFASDPERTLRPFLDDVSYVHGIPGDPRFTRRFRFVGAWRRNDSYYLVLYQR